MKIVTAAQMQTLDRRTIEEAGVPGAVLMERAGRGVVAVTETALGPLEGKTFTVFCGKGNNGGDGFVVARLLRQKHAHVQTILLGKPSELKGDAKAMYQRFIKAAGPSSVKSSPPTDTIENMLAKSHFVIDALLGTGISNEVKESYRIAIDAINASGIPVIAVDLPSGIHTDTGIILGSAVRAHLTVTFGYPKIGLYLGQAINCVGTVHIVDIGIPFHFIEDLEVKTHLITAPSIRGLIPTRRPSSHKGTFGHAGIIAGSPGKTGAAAMAARAALRTGVGLVTVATPTSANSLLEPKLLEAMTLPLPETEAGTLHFGALPQLHEFVHLRQGIAIGPGLTTHPDTVQVVRTIIPQIDCPCVLDADALNALNGHCHLFQSCKRPPLITPHPGEMARLHGQLSAKHINEDRLGVAVNFARTFNVIVVLKGARTVIANQEGSVAICSTGNPGMASAGMGDVLTGILVGLLAQGIPPFETAQLGTFLHGLAGDITALKLGQISMIAGDVIEAIPEAFRHIQQTETE